MKVLFLTEYSKRIGYGHLSRSLSLADQFDKHGYEVVYLIREWSDEDLSFPYLHYKAEWKDMHVLNRYLEANDICIIDTYQVSKTELNVVCESLPYPISISDSRLNFPDKGLVIIASVYGNDFKSEIPLHLDILAGPEYLLFRKEFWNRPMVNINPRIRKVFVSMGAFVSGDLLELIILAVRRVFNPVRIAMVGKVEVVQAHKDVVFLGFMSPTEYIAELSDTDLMISNGGQSLNEAILLGVPTIGVSVAENQDRNMVAWTDLGVVISCGSSREPLTEETLSGSFILIKDPIIRTRMVTTGRQIIDSRGSARVYKAIVDKLNASTGERR